MSWDVTVTASNDKSDNEVMLRECQTHSSSSASMVYCLKQAPLSLKQLTHQPSSDRLFLVLNLYLPTFSFVVLSSQLQMDTNSCVSFTVTFTCKSTIYKRRTLRKARRLPNPNVWPSVHTRQSVTQLFNASLLLVTTQLEAIDAKKRFSFITLLRINFFLRFF